MKLTDVTTRQIVETASNWHSGQWSALYRFASTGGTVWDETHRQQIIHETQQCFIETQDATERVKLLAIVAFVWTRPAVHAS